MIKAYDLGVSGREYLLHTLDDGRALSRALAMIVRQHSGRTYTLLPEGLEHAEVCELNKPLKKFDCPVERPDTFLVPLKNYRSIDVFVSHIGDAARSNSNAVLWTEDYLARPADAANVDPAMPKEIAVVYIQDTVTYLARGRIFSATNVANQIAKRMRSMPIWNGVLLRRLNINFVGNAMPLEIAESLLSEASIIFSTAYHMDGLIYFERF